MGVSSFTYNGTCSTSYGIKVEKHPDYLTPEKQIERIEIPGRNGYLLRTTGAYRNVSQKYDIYFNTKSSGFWDTARAVTAWLLSPTGYNRLEDSYDTAVFRLASVAKLEPIENWLGMYARMTVEFDCRPQRFLVAGETEIALADHTTVTVTNPGETCYPLFYIDTGTLTVNGNALETVDLSSQAYEYIYDSESDDCYQADGTGYVAGTRYPSQRICLLPGANTVHWNGTYDAKMIMRSFKL